MERPILFNTAMVKAILEDRKTNTRRVINVNKVYDFQGWLTATTGNQKNVGSAIFKLGCSCIYIKPPCQVGDTLWVRETFGKDSYGKYHYRAEYPEHDCEPYPIWHPSIHMPREAARLFLKVKDIKVERLQEITPENSIKEGLDVCISCIRHGGCHLPDMCNYLPQTMQVLWDDIYSNRDYSWEQNPWVWVISFEVAKNER